LWPVGSRQVQDHYSALRPGRERAARKPLGVVPPLSVPMSGPEYIRVRDPLQTRHPATGSRKLFP